MSLEKLMQEIESDSDRQASEVVGEAESQAKEILKSAQAESETVMAAAKKEALEMARAESVKISAARLQAKRIVSEAQESLVKKALACLTDELNAFVESKDYREFIETTAKRYSKDLKTKEFTVYGRKEDEKIISSMKMQFKPFIQTMGGISLESKDGVVFNQTFESLLIEKDDRLRQAASEYLFSDRKKKSKSF